MKAAALPALILGIAASIWLVVHYGYVGVATALFSVGWPGFLAVVAIHLGTIALCAGAWAFLLPPLRRPPLWLFVWSRFIRDGAGEILPFSQIGGLALGLRAAVIAGLPTARAVASLAADSAMELLSQLAYALLAVAIFAVLRPESGLAAPIGAGLAVADVAAMLWVLAQRHGLGALKRLVQAISRRSIEIGAFAAAAVQTEIDGIYGRPRGLAGGFFIHLFAWIAGAGETWIALRLMGAPLGLAPALAIEGLLHAARGAAFAVPGALGVQEGAYVVLGAQFGLGPDTALALSLLKRARDFTIGAPALLAWQMAEGRRLWRFFPGRAVVVAETQGELPASLRSGAGRPWRLDRR
jgi:putative membrane protein